jgi:hypothetical protein
MWEQHDASVWMQYTSKTPASRADVLVLEQALEARLQQRQARLTGLCPVREDLYQQAFGEWLAGCGREGGRERGTERTVVSGCGRVEPRSALPHSSP